MTELIHSHTISASADTDKSGYASSFFYLFQGCIVEESAVQVPLLVVTSMLEHATETVLMILRIDDILRTR